MMNKKTKALSALIISTAMISITAAVFADDNSLRDASFESGTSPNSGGWQTFEDSVFSTEQARSGQQSMLNGGYSRIVAYQPFFTGGISGSFQELPASPGSRWRLTGYGLVADKLKGAPAFGVIQISFFDVAGNDLGTEETAGKEHGAKTSLEINNQSPVDEWIFLDTGVVTAPDDTAVIHAFTLYVDYSSSNVPQGVFFDDLALCAIADGDDQTTSCDAN